MLVEGFQYHQHRALENFVFQRGNADRARLARSIGLGDVDAPHRRSPILPGLEPGEQARQVRFQVGFLVRRSDAVHARSAVFARAPIRFVQPLHIKVMRQRRERDLRLDPSQCRQL